MSSERERVSAQNGLAFYVEAPDHELRRVRFSRRSVVVANHEGDDFYYDDPGVELRDNEQRFEAWVEDK